MTDKDGVAIVVGDSVKLVGVIASIDESSKHFNGVVITPSFPAAGFIPAVNTVSPGPTVSNPQLKANYAFDGTQLVKGT